MGQIRTNFNRRWIDNNIGNIGILASINRVDENVTRCKTAGSAGGCRGRALSLLPMPLSMPLSMML